MNNRNNPSQPEESQKQRQDFDEGSDYLWSQYGMEALQYDGSRIKTLKDDMGSVLVFLRVRFSSGQPEFYIIPGRFILCCSHWRSSCQRSRA